MNDQMLLNKLADDIARKLWLPDDLIVREVRGADDLTDAKARLLSVHRDAVIALRIVRNAERTQEHGEEH